MIRNTWNVRKTIRSPSHGDSSFQGSRTYPKNSTTSQWLRSEKHGTMKLVGQFVPTRSNGLFTRHRNGTRTGTGKRVGSKWVHTNLLHRNVRTGRTQGKEPGSIVFRCAGPVPSTCPSLVPLQCRPTAGFPLFSSHEIP